MKQESPRVPITTILAVKTLFKSPRNWTPGRKGKLGPTFYKHVNAWIEMGLIERRKALVGPRRGYEYRRMVKSITFHEDCTMGFEMIYE